MVATHLGRILASGDTATLSVTHATTTVSGTSPPTVGADGDRPTATGARGGLE